MPPTVHDAHGWWIAEAGDPEVLPALEGDRAADVVVVGGGYTGLWAAWHVLAADPDARVVVLEAGRCGHGPSGRNGGFVSGMALSRPALAARFGEAPARAWVEAADATVHAIGAWCESEGVDAWYRHAGELVVAAAPGRHARGVAAVDGEAIVALDAGEARARFDSPVVRGAVHVRNGANVHPARLAFGLRARLIARGATVCEGSRVRALRATAGGVAAETAAGRVRARAAIVAAGAAGSALRPLRDRLTVSSSHIVCTEPVPDVIEALGWTVGESVSDGRTLLHYMRTTRDGRIVFGWAGGRMAAGARTGGRMEVDHAVVAQVRRDLLRFFPMLEGRRIAHAWGGPIDVSPIHLPAVISLPRLPAWAAFGYTGNGVGPSHLLGRTLAALALDRRDDVTRLPFVDPAPARVPPEPLRVAGAAVVRRALVRKEAAEEAGRRAGPVTRAGAALPGLMGMHIVR